MRVRLKLPRLIELIALGGLSQNHWAIRLGLSRGHWSAIVNGKHLYPSAKTRVRMLEVFQVPLDDLFEVETGNEAWADHDFRRAIAERYLVDSELGQGGMGAVYLARDVRHGRTVAVKVIAPEAVTGIGLVQFAREIATVAKLQHSNVLPFFDSGEAAGCPYYVMPWVRGGSLRRLLETRHRLDLADTLRLTRGMADALDYAHGERVLHCDIKPENVLLQGLHAWLMDFGIARKLRLDALGSFPGQELDYSAGTPAYVSPEQASGDRELDGRSDVYSLACMVFEMLSGRTPFEGTSTRAIVSQRFIEPPPPLSDFAPEIPPAVQQALERAMALPRERRPDSAGQFATELEQAAASASRVMVAVSLAATRTAARVRRQLGLTPAISGGFMRHLIRWPDLREAARSLARAPVVTVCAVLCLGLGLGTTTAMYSAVDRALLRPLPFPEPDRLVSLFRTTPHFITGPHSAPNLTDLAATPGQLAQLAGATPQATLLRLADEAVRVPGYRVTGSFFPVLGVRALHGRLLTPDDDTPGAPPAIVIGEELWRRRFGADPALVGQTLVSNGVSATVVGIAPRRLRVPHGGQNVRADVWTPMRFSENELRQRRSNFVYGVGRLAPGATVAGADAEMKARFDALLTSYPDLRGEQVRVVPIQQEGLQAVRTPLLLVFGAVCFVMLIAAANVASLLLARGVARRREMAIRTALGGSRWAVMRPVVVESLLLAAGGALLGLGLAALGIRTIGTLAAARLPQLEGLALDARLFVALLALALVVALLCAAAPAWFAAAVDPQDALRGGRGGGPGRAHHRALAGLIVTEVALSLVLLLGTGLVLRGFLGLLQRDPGFDPDRLHTFEVTLSDDRYTDRATVERFLEPALAAVRQVPGVADAAAITLVPYVNWGWNFNIRYEGQPGDQSTQLPITERRVVTPEFFGVMGQRLIAGRLLERGDDERDASPPVVVVNEALVRRDFPRGDAVGKRFHIGDTTFATIVGVVSDIRNVGPVADPRPEVYWTYRQGGRGQTTFPIVVRAAASDIDLGQSLLGAIRSVDPVAAVVDVQPMRDVIAQSVGRPRFYLVLLAVFAVTAIVLTMAGVYGVISYAVAQRTREIGIRAALGSTTPRTVALFAQNGMTLVGLGVLGGLAGGYGLTRLLASLLYGISPLDPMAWISAVGALVMSGLCATMLPAWRAARVDPVEALKGE